MKSDESYLARRRFLCRVLGGGAVALGASVAVPLGQYAGDFRPHPPPDFLEIAPADCDLAPGESKILMYGLVPALLIRTPAPESALRAFVATCTHLNCTVGYRADEGCILCACHNGRFDTDGRVLSGPPPGPLRQFHTARRNGKLIIALEKEDLEKAP
jgi:Rieske Fe-S protein